MSTPPFSLAPAEFTGSFAVAPLNRGLTYAQQGRVGEIARGSGARRPDEVAVYAPVVGSQGQRYSVAVVVVLDDYTGEVLEVISSCTCPVSTQCKHGAALCWSLVRNLDGEDPQPEWERELHELAGGLSPLLPSGEPPEALAVRFSFGEVVTSYISTRVTSEVRLRPMRPGAKKRWVQGGISWDDVRYRRQMSPQVTALQDLADIRLPESYGWRRLDDVPTDLFGAQLVPLLLRAQAAGVELVGAGRIREVRLLDEPLDLRAEVSGNDEGATVEVVLAGAATTWPLHDVTLCGEPAHTAIRNEQGVLTFAALVRRLPPGAVAALARRHQVQVPPQVDLTDFLTTVQRIVPIASPDGSHPLPEPVKPALVLTVGWKGAGEAHVAWAWRYGEALVAPEEADDVRDTAAEFALLAQLPQQPELAARVVTGVDALHLAILELPVWRACEHVEVVESDAPDFREADHGPEISFDTVATEHTDWLDVEVLITVGGERVPLADVLAALTRGEEFVVLPSGLFLRTDCPEFAALDDLVQAAAELHERDGDRVRVGRTDLGVLAMLHGLGVVEGQAQEWVAKAQALRDVVDLPDPEPVGLATELRHYQRDGFRWLAFLYEYGLGGILADDMGLGKTLQVLALVAHSRASTRAPFLVVAPTSVVSAWAEQAQRHTPELCVRTVLGTGRRRAESIEEVADGADVVVTSYTLLRLEAEAYREVEWAGVVLDEAQQVKNHRSLAYGAIRQLAAPFRLAVTGTPFENRLRELWALLSIVAPGLYPTAQKFTENVATPVERHSDAAALRRFTARVKPFMLRRTKQMVALDLPPKQEQVLPVELNSRHRKIYDTHLTRERQKILALLDDFNGNQIAILAALTRLRQMALDPALVDDAHDIVGSAKLDVLTEHVAEVVAEGHQALVFSSFTSFLDRAEERLRDLGAPFTRLDGATTNRASVIERFRAGEASVFLISLKAGGVGLTLTEADYVFMLDPWWNPAAEAQAVDRAHRIGQTNTVMVYRLVATDTIEDKVMALKARKQKLFAKVMDGDGATSTQLTADDIRGLFE